MRKYITMVLVALLLLPSLSGCRIAMPQETEGTSPSQPATQPSTQETQPESPKKTESINILANIWEAYADNERFTVYGGAVEKSVSNAPGNLDTTNTEELTARYWLPKECLQNILDGASLVHLSNNNIFTGIVVRLDETATLQTVAQSMRKNIQNNTWICGQPEKLLLADMGNHHLLMAFGSVDAVDTFQNKLSGVYADATILYEENITV